MTTLPTPLAHAVAAVRRRVRTRRAIEAGTLFAIVGLAAAAIALAVFSPIWKMRRFV